MKKLLAQLLWNKLSIASVIGTVLTEEANKKASLENQVLKDYAEWGLLEGVSASKGKDRKGLEKLLIEIGCKITDLKRGITEPSYSPEKSVNTGEQVSHIFAAVFSTHLGAAMSQEDAEEFLLWKAEKAKATDIIAEANAAAGNITAAALKNAEVIKLILAELSAQGVEITELNLDGSVKTEPAEGEDLPFGDVFVKMPKVIFKALKAFMSKDDSNEKRC